MDTLCFVKIFESFLKVFAKVREGFLPVFLPESLELSKVSFMLSIGLPGRPEEGKFKKPHAQNTFDDM